jgi:hypothetical protein
MALDHARPGQPINIAPLGIALRESATHAILKTRSLEVIRVVLRAGDALPPHAVRGELTLLCIEGAAEVTSGGTVCQLREPARPAAAGGRARRACAGRHLTALDHPIACR